jgi:hypothetical protein
MRAKSLMLTEEREREDEIKQVHLQILLLFHDNTLVCTQPAGFILMSRNQMFFSLSL